LTEINYKDKKAFERINHLDEEISNFSDRINKLHGDMSEKNI
jgi:hypothetical protein